MNIPKELEERMKILGDSPDQYADVLKTRGQEFFISVLQLHVERREESIALYQQWSPRLREYAAECRARNPCPDPATLTDRDRAKLPIYKDKIASAERLCFRDGRGVIICSIPLIGIPVAQQLWPGEDGLAVILTPEELRGWRNIYKHPKDATDWWIDYRWTIDDQPDPEFILYKEMDLTVAAGESPWLVISGVRWGRQAGDERTDLWSWNGSKAQFVRDVEVLIF